MLTVGSLFAGIGGLDLGLERAGMNVKWQVEIEDYPTEVLELRWSETEKIRDIRDFNATLSQAGFHVQEYRMQENTPDYQMSVLRCGGKCYRPFAWWDQDTSSWRTWQHSLIGEWVKYSDPWPRAGMIRNGIAYRQRPLVRSIFARGSSYWPTPTRADASGRTYQYSHGDHAKKALTLCGYVRKIDGPGPFNPALWEWLMGFPPGWTDLKPLETQSYPRSPSSLEGRSSNSIGEGMAQNKENDDR